MRENERQHGQAAILLALALVGLIAFAALAIDGGNAYFVRRNSQNASDAAAYAGSREVFIMRHLPSQTCTAPSSTVITGTTCLLAVINEQAERNGVPDTGGDPFDAVNHNVEASYLSEDGEIIGDPLVPGNGLPEVEVLGVIVSTTIPFDTFIAGIIGRSEMAATTTSATLLADKVNAVNHAIWADSDCLQQTVCSLTGSWQQVEGGIHSNAELKIEPGGSDLSYYTGTLEYAADEHYVNLDKVVLYPTAGLTNPAQVPVDHLPLLFDIEDFAPGGEYISQLDPAAGGVASTKVFTACAGQYYYYGPASGATQPEMIMEPGLHYSDHPKGLSIGHQEALVPLAVTIVTDGQVNVNISVDDVSLLLPCVEGLLIFSTYQDPDGDGRGDCPCNDTALNMPTSEVHWEGFIYAPYGKVDMSFSANSSFRGSIVAWVVAISGSEFSLTYDPLYDPDWDPRVTLIK